MRIKQVRNDRPRFNIGGTLDVFRMSAHMKADLHDTVGLFPDHRDLAAATKKRPLRAFRNADVRLNGFGLVGPCHVFYNILFAVL